MGGGYVAGGEERRAWGGAPTGALQHHACRGCLSGAFGTNAQRVSATRPSVTSTPKCRIEPFELGTGRFGGELPVDLGLDLVAAGLPGTHLRAHGLNVCNAAVEALAYHHIDFNLGHVEPAAVFGRVNELKAIPQCFGLVWCKRLVQ